MRAVSDGRRRRSLVDLQRARPLTGEIVDEEEDVPELLFSDELLPRGHRRVPGSTLFRQSGTALGCSPEEKRLAEIRDRVAVGKVGWNRIQSVNEHAVAAQVVAVAEHAVLVVDAAPVLDVFAE